jgi:hypothetical protein
VKNRRRVNHLRRIAKRAAKLVPAVSTIGGLGAVAALPPTAEAGVIHSSIVNLSIPVTTAGVYVNVVTGTSSNTPSGVPGWDLNPWGSSALNFWANNAAELNDGMMTLSGAPTLVANLTPGSSVDGTDTFVRTAGIAGVGATPGQFQLSGLNYVGFRFVSDTDGLTHFGWASVFLGPTLTDPSRKLVDVYYESGADTAIVVGDTGAASSAPEPSTALLLAAGASGLFAFRRRRRESN